MDWIQVKILTTTQGIEPVSGRLYQLGITGLEIEDAADFNDFLENATQYWDYVDDELMAKKDQQTAVKVYVSNNEAGLQLLEEIKQELIALGSMDRDGQFGTLETELVNLNEQDWSENWKKYYKPLKVGEKILIRPEWEEIADSEGRVVFTINPGMSFGTGTHQSTQLCIEQLEKQLKKDDEVLDLGCGSGILSIIAMLLGARSALAIDIDPNAADIALQNAAKNPIDHANYQAVAGNILADDALVAKLQAHKYNIVLANIVADVIIPLSAYAKDLLKDGGVLIASGIISFRLDDVKAALTKNGLEMVDVLIKDDWAAIVAK